MNNTDRFLMIIVITGLVVLVITSLYVGKNLAKQNAERITDLYEQLDKLEQLIEEIEPIIINNEIIMPEWPEPEARNRGTVQTAQNHQSDLDLLARLIHAEARGESYEGKLAVGQVVLNRVASSQFPNTIQEVIYQPRQFTPTSNGAIHNTPNVDSIRAAKEVLSNHEPSDIYYFYNPSIATSSWIFTRETVQQIGNHVFAK